MTTATLLELPGVKAAPQKKEPILKNIILSEAGKGVAKFITEQVDLGRKGVLLITKTGKYTSSPPAGELGQKIIDLRLINQQPYDLDTFFRAANAQLPDAGIYIGCVESNSIRKEQIFRKYPASLARIIWAGDFIWKRMLPKLSFTRKLFKTFFGDGEHVLSKAETLGRLCFAGFEIIGHELINNRFYFSVIKVKKEPSRHAPSGGLIFKMPRISKDGKSIGVYKIRTMHPYSEYLQDYVVKMNGYNATGKPNKDFRLTHWGKIIRKLHLDELPQLLNVLKGDLNLVGVRPISRFGFHALPKDLQQDRIKFKPGCIPPNVSLGLKGFDGVVQAERIYLAEMKKHGAVTNVKYFWMAIYNLVRKRNVSA